MSRRASPSTSRAYGLLRVARLWGISRATLYRHRRCDQPGSRRRPGPIGPMPDEALVEAIRALLAASPFHGEGHRKVWARLRFAGVRSSKRRVLRLMRAHDLLAPSRVGRPHGPQAHDGTIAVDSVIGHGTTFVVTLPVVQGPPEQARLRQGEVPAHGPRRKHPSTAQCLVHGGVVKIAAPPEEVREGRLRQGAE